MNTWTSVNDSLPTSGQHVLVCDVYGNRFTAYLNTDTEKWQSNAFGEALDTEVTHWMRLPDGPAK